MKGVFCFALSTLIVISCLFAAGCAGEREGTEAVTTESVETVTETEEETVTEALTEALTEEETTETVTETEAPVRLELDFTKPLVAEGTKILTLKCPEKDYITAQGCCFDGENWVAAFNKFDKNGEECTLLCKFDKKGNLVKTSDGPLYLEHANNVTYLPELSAYYVTSCQGSITECWNGYSIVDKDSLELLEKGTLPQPFFAMSYCPERQAYASARWCGEILDFWDSDRNHIATKDVTPPGTLSQGVFAAPDYVWFVRSSQNGYKQEFRVYDWDGELVAAIPLHLKNDAESESVNIIDGVVYVTSNAGRRAYLYTVEFKTEE